MANMGDSCLCCVISWCLDGRYGMTKPDLLKLMRLLSALESALMYDRQASTRMPDYLLEDLNSYTEILEKEILK